jgi:dinuclear metal center YbgI/SA1388 family protein
MLVREFGELLDRLAPLALAQPGDNSGLLVGEEAASVTRVLVALELTEGVLAEALDRDCDAVLTHHPLLYAPLRSLVDSPSRPGSKERLALGLVRAGVSLFAWHTNLDAAPGGLASICADALALRDQVPLQRAAAGWYKLVGFIPQEALDRVAAAVFAAGAGRIGNYKECAYAVEGVGWFTAEAGAHPAVGSVAVPERTPEVRWETVVPRARVGEVVSAFVRAHPYEEPAFDLYPVEDVLPRAGLGRVGDLPESLTLAALAQRVEEVFSLPGCRFAGEAERVVSRVAVLPGSGRGALESARGCDVLVTGDVSYHDAERAAELGVALVVVPHEALEWWALKKWALRLATEVSPHGVEILTSQAWCSPWQMMGGQASPKSTGALAPNSRDAFATGKPDVPQPTAEPQVAAVRLWIDGGSRGNPGPSAIGVVMKDLSGKVLRTLAKPIGWATNNVAEYRALLAGLSLAREVGAREVEVVADSELLVKQMRGEYQVKNGGLIPLHQEARRVARDFARFTIRHVPREENCVADALVNQALNETQRSLDETQGTLDETRGILDENPGQDQGPGLHEAGA